MPQRIIGFGGSMRISVFLADDNLIVREGVKALLDLEDDLEVIGEAADYQQLVDGAGSANPQVVVTDIRMPPDFTREGIEAAKEIRKQHPGTGIVILSQFDDPDYAVSLLAEGAAGYAYLLKDRVGEGDQLVRAVREVAAGGSVLDPKIVDSLTSPVRSDSSLSPDEEELLQFVAEGRTINAIAAARDTTPAAANAEVEALFLKLGQGLTAGRSDSLGRLKMLQRAIVDRKEQGESISRLLPAGVAAQILNGGQKPGDSVELVVTVLMSDIRGYTTIAEKADPSVLAAQLNEHRVAMNHAIAEQGGTVMQYVGDAVMAVFGAPIPQQDHANLAWAAAQAMQAAQADVNRRWEEEGRAAFGLGIGLSTGKVAAALLGSEERLEYTVIGDTVNLSQRLQQWAEPGETVLSEPSWLAIADKPEADKLDPATVKGREMAVSAYRFPRRSP
jgi:class 3 adenylate cyclase/ActR/RegA family two-component response regulator